MATKFMQAAKLFEDRIDVEKRFESLEYESTKSSLMEIIKNDTTELTFLLGEPGVGKTFLLKSLLRDLFFQKRVMWFDTPFFDYDQFLDKFICSFPGQKLEKIEDKKKKAVELAQGNEHIVFIDEAQLLSDYQVEFLRTLSDTKAFCIVMAMHKTDGKAVLNKKHFKSRSKKVIYLNPLGKHEVKQYIEQTLLANEMGDLQMLFDRKTLNLIHKFTDANFRAIKRIVHSIFELMDYEVQSRIATEPKLGKCLVTMAAIDSELLNA